MNPLVHDIWKKANVTYHRLMYTYHYTLYRDCLDLIMKERHYIKVKKHEQWEAHPKSFN